MFEELVFGVCCEYEDVCEVVCVGMLFDVFE